MEDLVKRIESLEELVLWQKDVLTFKEACKFLDLASSYLYKLCHLQKIPHYKPNGKKLYFDRDELVMWMKQGKVSSKKLILVDDNGEEEYLRPVAVSDGEMVLTVDK